jgi:hypothetical protein
MPGRAEFSITIPGEEPELARVSFIILSVITPAYQPNVTLITQFV